MRNTSGFNNKQRKRSPGDTRGGPSCGKRNTWAKRLNGRAYAQMQFELRQSRNKAKKIANAGEKVVEAAREVLEKTYGGPLPIPYEQPLDHKAVAPGISPNVLTSKDQRELMADMDLLARAAKEQWPVDDTTKMLCVARVKQILAKQAGVKDEVYLKAVETAVKIDRQNAYWMAMANPQKHEHVHVEIEQPAIEQRRAAVLEFIRQNGIPGTAGPTRNIDGPDDEQCIDVGK